MPPDTEPPAGVSRGELRRRRIIVTTRALVMRHGFVGTSVAQIATASELHIGQLYRDFPNKEAIIEAIAQEDMNSLSFEPMAVGLAPDRMLDHLADWLETLFLRITSDDGPCLYLDIQAEATRNPSIADIMSALEAKVRSVFLAALRHYDGERRSQAERERIADLLLVLIPGLSSRHSLRPTMDIGLLIAQLRDVMKCQIALDRAA